MIYYSEQLFRTDRIFRSRYSDLPGMTIPTRLLPRPRLGDRRLFAGYNVMLGLDDGPVADDLPMTVRIRVGRLRDQAFERKQQQQPVVSDEAESDEGLFVL